MPSWSIRIAARRAPSAKSSKHIHRRGAEQLQIVDHGNAAVVTCTGRFTGPQFSGALKFMRVWLKRDGRWQIVAGSIANC